MTSAAAGSVGLAHDGAALLPHALLVAPGPRPPLPVEPLRFEPGNDWDAAPAPVVAPSVG